MKENIYKLTTNHTMNDNATHSDISYNNFLSYVLLQPVVRAI
jgi:hypothetical protein